MRLKVEILRRARGGAPYWETFLYEGEAHRSVAFLLDTLNYRDDLYNIDGQKSRRIAWECACRQKQCGACAMRICGTPALACATFLDEVRLRGDRLVLEPLHKFPTIEDLRVDRSVLYEQISELQLWLDAPARKIPPRQFEDCYNAGKCLKCGLCLEVCPNYTGGRFAGPAAVAESFLALCQGAPVDAQVRRRVLAGCSKSGACQRVCPVGMQTLGMLAKLAGGKYKK